MIAIHTEPSQIADFVFSIWNIGDALVHDIDNKISKCDNFCKLATAISTNYGVCARLASYNQGG